MVRYVKKKVYIKPSIDFTGIIPKFVKGSTIEIEFPIKEEGDKEDKRFLGRRYGYR